MRHPITGTEPGSEVTPKNRDSNGIGAAVVDGRQALEIATSTMPTVRFPAVNADIDRPNPALVVNCLIQVVFLCAVETVNNSFHRYDERPVDNFSPRPELVTGFAGAARASVQAGAAARMPRMHRLDPAWSYPYAGGGPELAWLARHPLERIEEER